MTLHPTPRRLELMRAIVAGEVQAWRDGALVLHCEFNGRSVVGEVYKLINATPRLVKPAGWDLADQTLKATEDGRQWLAKYDGAKQ